VIKTASPEVTTTTAATASAAAAEVPAGEERTAAAGTAEEARAECLESIEGIIILCYLEMNSFSLFSNRGEENNK